MVGLGGFIMLRLQMAACVAALVLTATLQVHAGEKSDSKVKASVKAGKVGADGKQSVTITIDVQKSWYIYANPVKAEDFEDNATRVTFLKGKDKLKAEVIYPKGKAKETKVGKTTISYNIYENQVVIDAVVLRTAGDAGPITVAIEVNSCSGGTCLAPGTVKLTVP
jgi:hypothetical protein